MKRLTRCLLPLAAFPILTSAADPPARRVQWVTTLQTGAADTFQLTLGGVFGEGPAWQNRVDSGLSNLFTKSDSLFVYGANSFDAPSRVNNWQAGLGYRRPVWQRGKHEFTFTGGLQHWLFPAVKTGTNDWLTYENLTYRTTAWKFPFFVTNDSWSLLKSPLPLGTLLHTQAWLEHPLFKKESVRISFRHGPAQTYSWGFYGTNGYRVFRYQTMLAISWKSNRVEGGYRKQWGMQPGIPDNPYWQVSVSRTFVH